VGEIGIEGADEILLMREDRGLERVQIAAPLGKRWRTIPQTRGAPLGNVAVRVLSLSVGGAAFMVDSLDVKGGRTIMLV